MRSFGPHSTVHYGAEAPMEIHVHCDHYDCAAAALVWLQGRDPFPPSANATPLGWRIRDGKTYCPEHR